MVFVNSTAPENGMIDCFRNIKLERILGRLVLRVGDSAHGAEFTLSKEEEAEFWTQVETVIDPDFKVRR